jgi:hypothetical protein
MNQRYYQRLCWWRIITIVAARLIQPGDYHHPVYKELQSITMQSLADCASPCIRQYF